MLGVDERAHAAELLGLGEDVVDERRLTRGLRAEDLDDAAARDATDAERDVERQRSGRDRVDGDPRSGVAHPHDGALAELALDLGERALQCRLALGVGLRVSAPPACASSLLAHLVRLLVSCALNRHGRRGGGRNDARAGPATEQDAFDTNLEKMSCGAPQDGRM